MSHRYEIKDHWCQHIPLLHRILAGSALPSDFPAPSRAAGLDAACTSWETLHYLLTSLLGWQNPGLGLAWWYQQGKPVQDSLLLQTVSELWNRNSEIDFYAAWAWRQQVASSTVAQNSATVMAKESLYPDVGWWAEFIRRPAPHWCNPYYGGYNPLHLGHSEWFLNKEPVNDAFDLFSDLATRRAVLVVNNIATWKQDLHQAQQQLPDVKDRSWHVQVFDGQHGSLGTFRRSRETGRWFQGKHSIHMVGNITQTTKVEA